MTATPVPLNAITTRPRAAAIVRGGFVTWSCPLCEHRSVTDPAHRLAWVLERARYHMRWGHGHLAIVDWLPAGARRVTASELATRTQVPRRPQVARKQPVVIDLAAQNPTALAA